jgi:acetylornithine deacetylase/succinyl-diaminopimelate desuccinylase family protein
MDSPIHKDEVIELTRELVRVPSLNPPGDTRDCAEMILRTFKKERIDAEIMEGKEGFCNVVARLPGKSGGKTLLLNGHIDVVLPGEGWTVDPFGAEIRDDKIYGRGTCDMKSGIAAMMAAMIGIKRSGASFHGEITFMGAADEETGSEFGTLYLLKKGVAEKADFAIVSEPTSLRVELGNRGLRWIDMIVRGKASHAGRPHLGINAISYGAKLIEAIHSMKFGNRNDAFEIPEPSISVTQIHGGVKENIIPDRCELTLDRRMIPGETSETILAELKRVIDPILGKEKELRIEWKMRPVYWDPYLIAENEPIAQATIDSAREVLGEEPVIGGKAACTDASYLFHLGRVPTVLFGPGNETLSHKPDECVPIRNLLMGTEVYRSVFKKLLGP